MPRKATWTPPQTPFRWEHVAPLGVSRAQIRRALAAGCITRLANGVHIATEAVPSDPIARHLMTAAAHQLLRPDAIASHHTAALAWQLELDDATAAAAVPPAFILPSGGCRRSEPAGAVSIAVRDLPATHRMLHPSGLLVTTPARAAVDVASGLSLPEALITLDSAARLALAERVGRRALRDHYTKERSLAACRDELIEASGVAATQFTRRHLGTVVPLADPRRESAAESLSYGHMVLAQLPLPELQVRIGLGDAAAYPDFLWAKAMVIGEVDGMLKYQTPDDLRLEKRRQELLEGLGHLVVRWEAREIRVRPTAVMHRIFSALDARGMWG